MEWLDWLLRALALASVGGAVAALLFGRALGMPGRRAAPLWLLLAVASAWHALTGSAFDTLGVTYALLLGAWLEGVRLRRDRRRREGAERDAAGVLRRGHAPLSRNRTQHTRGSAAR